MDEKSKILIIGGTGYIGKFIVEASAKAGHPTFALVRESTIYNPEKFKLIQSFKTSGVNLLHGDINDHESLVNVIKQVDVVISTVGPEQPADQVKIIAAIKQAGTVKRLFVSEFGMDVDRVHAVEPAASIFRVKASIRRAIEANATVPPRDKVVILGDGNPKGVYVNEEDIANYTIKAVDDPRTLNKVLYVRPPGNVLSFNEIVSLWEKKIDKTLEKIYIPEDQLLKNIQESPVPLNIILSICYSMLVKGDATNFEIEACFGVEASELYPEVKHTTLDKFLDQFV